MKKSILFIALIALFAACKREYDPAKFGPEIIIVGEDFTVSGFTVSPSNSINLATQDAYFHCSMDQSAEFKIIIKGLLSEAEKTIHGSGLFINETNSNWTGDSDNLNIFSVGEKCLVELSFRGARQKYYDTITVTAENLYPNTTLINDFEGIVFDKNGPNIVSYGTYLDDFDESDIKTDNTLKTCQGSQNVSFDGLDANGSYYIGGVYFAPSVPTPYSFSGYASDSLYVNAYIYSYGDNNTSLIFVFSEDDNGDNAIDLTNDDKWAKEVSVDGQGWSLVSIRFNDFVDDNPSVGNGIFNPDKVKEFNINFKSKLPGTKARANVDYLIVSYGKPFEP